MPGYVGGCTDTKVRFNNEWPLLEGMAAARAGMKTQGREGVLQK